ncbi:hypothetical protein CR513_36910, partial [Mucuna pruriens]
STSNNLHKFDLEIDWTLYRLRKFRSADVGGSSNFISALDSANNTCTTNNSDFADSSNFGNNSKPGIFYNKSHELEQMENNNKTLKELATSNYPQLEPAQSYELKSVLIQLLPKFHDPISEDPHKHLKEFHVVCSTMRPVSLFPRWSRKGLTILIVDSIQHLGGHEANVFGKFLLDFQNYNHLKGDLWYQATFQRNFA